MSQKWKFEFLLQILAAQAKIWHGEADVAFFEQSGGKNGNAYVRNLFDDDLNSFFMSDRDTVAEVKELRTTFKKPVFFNKVTIHKRTDVPFAYKEGVPQCCIAGMSQYKNVCLVINNDEDNQLCTDDNYGWAKDDWKTNREITWEMPIKDVTSVSLIFRDQGYISATDYKIFYNDTMPNIISTSEVKTKIDKWSHGEYYSFAKKFVTNNDPPKRKIKRDAEQDTTTTEDPGMKSIRLAAHGEKIQIGQYYDFNQKEIIWAFPRLFDGTSSMNDNTELKVEYFTKEEFQHKIHDLKVQASVKLKLAIDIPVDIEGSAAYNSHEDDSSLTQRIILKISKKAGIRETSQSDLATIRKRSSEEPMTTFNTDATHVVSQIEYGSEVFIEMVHTDTMSVSQTDISGNLKVSVELVAGMIEGEADMTLTAEEEEFNSKTTFTIYGTLKKTIFATSFKSLAKLIKDLKANPDEYLSEVPQVWFF